MPIEIRELVIKVKVGNDRQAAPAQSGAGGGDNQQIVQECVDQVMEILKEKKER